jgi:hypothetical protein
LPQLIGMKQDRFSVALLSMATYESLAGESCCALLVVIVVDTLPFAAFGAFGVAIFGGGGAMELLCDGVVQVRGWNFLATRRA